MTSELNQLIGQWISLLGVTLAAIGHTKRVKNNEDTPAQLRSLGRAIQGSGNAIQALNEAEENYVQVGNLIQATGAAATSYASRLMLIGNQLES